MPTDSSQPIASPVEIVVRIKVRAARGNATTRVNRAKEVQEQDIPSKFGSGAENNVAFNFSSFRFPVTESRSRDHVLEALFHRAEHSLNSPIGTGFGSWFFSPCSPKQALLQTLLSWLSM